MPDKNNFSRMGSRERAEHCLLTLEWAVYHAAHDYEGGPAAIAGTHGLVPSTLGNKVNPRCHTHVVNLKDLEVVCLSTQDHRILRTVCSWFNAGFYLMPNVAGGGEALFARGADLAREFSELMASVQASMQDGHVTADEVALLDNALQELVTAAKTLVESAKVIGGAIDGQR